MPSLPRDRDHDYPSTPIAVKGAVDPFFARPLDTNPYARDVAVDGWKSWRYGWTEAAWFERTRGDKEQARWWREPG